MQNPLRRSSDKDNDSGDYSIASITRQVAQLEVGYASLERRVAEGQASVERDLGQLRTEFSSGIRDLQASMQVMNERLVTARQVNWQPVQVGVSVVMAAITVGYLFINQQITSSASRLDTAVATAQRDIAAVESRGSTGRAMLNDRIDNEVDNIHSRLENTGKQFLDRLGRQSEAIVDLRTNLAAIKQGLVEIETQFAALETYDNLRFVALHRWFSVIYEKVFGQKFPEVFVEPKISRSRGN